MARRNPIPARWLMTDERMGDALWPVLTRLPPGSGVVFRHYATTARERRALLRRVKRIAQARRLVVVVAGKPVIAADGVHGRGKTHGIRTWPAHSRHEALAGKRAGAAALFVSPIHVTRSHQGAAGIGPAQALRIGRGLGIPMIALGGMTESRWRQIRRFGFHGWAAIDAWIR
ncbi:MULTISPECIES: thiamine phosphate synthase [unclassified Sphingomonas]|uniref:thiamine phosphate synthase n=1 Tax=unclassified Sphingomonas TaxID=196159 RepID=UPI001FB43518|nr:MULTISPECIES: thiamine phosphate synthase [unclassified Sphingomonas]